MMPRRVSTGPLSFYNNRYQTRISFIPHVWLIVTITERIELV